MKISEKKTHQLFIQAFTNSEWDMADFALITLTDQLLKKMDDAFLALQPLKESHPCAELTFYDGQCTFHLSDERKDTSDLLQKTLDSDCAYLCVEPVSHDGLPPIEQTITGLKTAVQADGTVRFTGYGKHTGEEYWTAYFRYEDLKEVPKTTEMTQQVDLHVKMTFEVNASIERDVIEHQLAYWIEETMLLMDDAAGDYAFIGSTLLSLKEEADIYGTEDAEKEKGD